MASGGKFLTGLLSFIFGFLFGIIAIIGSVAGVALYALTANFDDLFEIAGIENRDENGDYVYVNTGVEGITNALDLIEKLSIFANDPMNKTLAEIDYYFPVTSSLVDKLDETFSKFGVEVDVEALKVTKFNELGGWIKDTIYSIELSNVIEKNDLGDLTNTNVASVDEVINLLIYGKKVQFVKNGSQKYEVYTDTYTLAEDGYVRVADGRMVPIDFEHWMLNERVQTDGTFYDVKYYNANGNWYVTDENLSYTAGNVGRSLQATNWIYTAYSSAVQGSAGDYYVDDNGKNVVINPITIGDLIGEGYLIGLLDQVYITDFVASVGNEIIGEFLGGITLGALLDQKIDFDQIINGAELSALLGDVKVTDSLLIYVLHGVTGVTANGDGTYIGTYYPLDENGYVISGEPASQVNITVDGENFIKSITLDGKKKPGTTVGQINGLISGVMDVLAISDLLDISDSSIMAYIGYGISGMEEVEGKSYQYTAKISDDDPDNEDVTVYVVTTNGYIDGVYYDPALTQPVSGTKIGNISGIVDGIMEDLKVKDIINIDPDNALMVKIGEYTISNIGDAIDEIVLPDVMDIKVDNSIMAYMGYGIKGVEENAGEGYTHTATYILINEDSSKEEFDCFINTDANGVITEAWYVDGERKEVAGTVVNGVGDRVDGVTEDLLVKDIIDIDPEDKLMSKLGEYSINNIGDAIDDILITDVMDIDADNAIMAYMGYGVKGVEENAGEGYTHTATYIYVDEADNKEEYPCYINTDANGVITEIWYFNLGAKVDVEGTPVNGVGDRIDGVTEDLLVKDIIDIDPEDKLMSKLGEYSINNMGDAIDDILITDVMDIEADSAIMAYMGYGVTAIEESAGLGYTHTATYIYVDEADNKEEIPCYIIADASGVITKVWYVGANGEQEVEGTPVNGVGDRIDGITEDLKIKDVIDIDPDDKFMSKLGEYKLNEMGSAVDELELGDFMDVEIKESGNILAYVAYGLTNINAVSGEEYQYVATIDGANAYVTVDGTKKITGVYQDATLQTLFVGTRVNNVGERVDGIMEDLTLGDIITISPDNTMLYALRNTTVNGISDRISTLSIQELYANSIYEDDVLDEVTSSTFNSNYIYYVYEDGEYVYVNNQDDANRGKLTAFNTENTYYTYGEAKGVWKFMVYKNGSEKLYTVNDMGDLMNNTTENIGEATLYDLADAGIIDKSLLYHEDGVTPKVINVPVPGFVPVEMGTLTIEGLIEVIGTFT